MRPESVSLKSLVHAMRFAGTAHRTGGAVHGRHVARDAHRAREFASFVAGAGGRLMHAATLLTAEAPDCNPRARHLLTRALAHTYATWDTLRGEDPYERARQQLAVRFARAAWHQHRGHHWYAQRYTRWYDLWDALWYALWDVRRHGAEGEPGAPGGEDAGTSLGERLRRGAHPGGVLEALTPQERLVLVLRMYEGVAEEQTAALLGLPVVRVRAVCERAMSTLLHPPPAPTRPLPKVVPS
jgi:hypothetical protein